MKTKKLVSYLVFCLVVLLIGSVLFGCAPKAATTAPTTTKPATTTPATTTTGPATTTTTVPTTTAPTTTVSKYGGTLRIMVSPSSISGYFGLPAKMIEGQIECSLATISKAFNISVLVFVSKIGKPITSWRKLLQMSVSSTISQLLVSLFQAHQILFLS